MTDGFNRSGRVALALLAFLVLGGTGCEDVGWEAADAPATVSAGGESSTPTVAENTDTETEEAQEEEATGETGTPPQSLPAPGTSREISNHDGGGGFVNNPENSRGTLKVIFPSEYSGAIVTVSATGPGGFSETLDRALPNESSNRERYYGDRPISMYPDNLVVTAFLSNGSSIYVRIPDPQRRYD